MESIRVPGSVLRRIIQALQWVTPLLLTGLMTWIGVGWSWIAARVDVDTVAKLIAPVSIAAKEAQTDAHKAASRIPEFALEHEMLWREVVILRAESIVHRRYGDKPIRERNELMERARVFYGNAYDSAREATPGEAPSKSATRALRLAWRPDLGQ